MKGEFVVNPSNLEATATMLTMNETAGFSNLDVEQAKLKLIENIKRVYLQTISNEEDCKKVFELESSWPVWKGVLCCFIPFTSGAGYNVIFSEEAGNHKLIEAVLYFSLSQKDFAFLKNKLA